MPSRPTQDDPLDGHDQPGPCDGTSTSDRVALWNRIYGAQDGLIGLLSGYRRPDASGLADVREQYFSWPSGANQAAEWVAAEAAQGRETYHCAHLLTAPRRVKDHAAPVTTLWADGDGAQVPDNLPPPTAVIETSPGREQFYWRLSQAIPPHIAEQLAKRLAYAMGADKTGWDLGQLLRPPGTPNHKYPDAPNVRLVYLRDLAYDPDELNRVLPALSTAPLSRVSKTRAEPVDLPMTLLSVDVQRLQIPAPIKDLIRQGAPKGKRSDAVWTVERELLRVGYGDEDIAAVLLDPRNGISEKPQEQGRAWVAAELARARAKLMDDENIQNLNQVLEEADAILAEKERAEPEPSPFRTLAQMQVERPDATAPVALVEGLIFPGAITTIAGGSKDEGGGKTTWLTEAVNAVVTGRSFCGLTTEPTPVVYLIEEGETTLRPRCQALGVDLHRITWVTGQHVYTYATWEERIDATIAEAERIGAKLIVIDTFSHWAALDPEQEWDDAAVSQRLRYLRKATVKDIAVVVVHHFNRRGSYRGATAFKAAVDIFCEFRRPKSGPRTQRVLTATGRFAERRLLLDFDPQTQQYRAAGAGVLVPDGAQGSTTAKGSSQEQRATTEFSRKNDASRASKLWALIPTVPAGLSMRELKERYHAEHHEQLSDAHAHRLLQGWVGSGDLGSTGTPRSKKTPLRYYRAHD